MTHLRIKELLKEKSLTSKDLASKLEITENGLSLVINGKRQPRFELLEAIAEKLNVDMWQLFAGSGSGLNGFVEYAGVVHRIRSVQDIEKLLEEIRGKAIKE